MDPGKKGQVVVYERPLVTQKMWQVQTSTRRDILDPQIKERFAQCSLQTTERCS